MYLTSNFLNGVWSHRWELGDIADGFLNLGKKGRHFLELTDPMVEEYNLQDMLEGKPVLDIRIREGIKKKIDLF